MSEETIPPHGERRMDRRSEDPRIQQLIDDVSDTKSALERNTKLTEDNRTEIKALADTMAEVKTGNNSLLEMKLIIEKHIDVMCTWARWFKRGAWGLLSVAGVALPVVVALKQLGWF